MIVNAYGTKRFSRCPNSCKPCREIFEKALEVAGCKPEEAVHIGDSVVSDVEGASTVGIQPVLIDRSGKEKCDKAIVVKSLDEVINLIK